MEYVMLVVNIVIYREVYYSHWLNTGWNERRRMRQILAYVLPVCNEAQNITNELQCLVQMLSYRVTRVAFIH